LESGALGALHAPAAPDHARDGLDLGVAEVGADDRDAHAAHNSMRVLDSLRHACRIRRMSSVPSLHSPPAPSFLTIHKKTHSCGELRAADVGKQVVLCGWVHN